MKDTDWKDIAELVGIAAIVASLLFVGLQMQQDRHLVRAELAAQTYTNFADLDLARSDGSVSAAFAKAISNPRELTLQEKLQIESQLQAFVSLLRRECFLVSIEVFVECEGVVDGGAPALFSNAYAQSWWASNHVRLRLPDWVNDKISRIRVTNATGKDAGEPR